MTLDLRHIEAFVRLADRLNYGAAAGDLHVSQSTLTRQVQALEASLGVTLFRRSRQGTELTDEGCAVLEDARSVLAAASQLEQTAADTRNGTGALTVGFMPGTDSDMIITAFRTEYPDVDVVATYVPLQEQTTMITGGAVDIAFVRFPFATAQGIRTIGLFEEPMVAAIPDAAADMFRGADSGTPLADLSRVLRPVPETDSPEQALTSVAMHGRFALLPVGIASFFRPPGVAFIRVRDVEPTTVGIAYDTRRRIPTLERFITFARDWMTPTVHDFLVDLTGPDRG
jgi:DNA-binding transcriptional LysR family regulator